VDLLLSQGLGFLSDGSVELKQPADLMGSHVGETAQKTAALIDNCRGKVYGNILPPFFFPPSYLDKAWVPIASA